MQRKGGGDAECDGRERTVSLVARQQAEARYELAEPERGEEGDEDGHAGQARPAQVCDDASALPHPGREDERVGRQGGVAKEPVEDDGLRLAERGEETQKGAHHQDVASLGEKRSA